VSEQLRLEGTEVPSRPSRLRPATCALGKHWVAECRAVLAAASEKSQTRD
jgi:hypothetical protein